MSEVGVSFRQILRLDDEVHDHTVGLLSYMYRPASPGSNQFDSTRMTLDRFNLLVHRAQWRQYRDQAVRSNVLSVYRFVYNHLTGRVVIDATDDELCNPAVWDVALPRSARHNPLVLNPDRNRTAARVAILLHRAAVGVAQFGHPASSAPEFPDFYLAFGAARPPVPERTQCLLAATRLRHPDLADTPDDLVPDAACHAVFASLVTREGGRILVPHRLLARTPGERHAIHPHDGTRPPEVHARAWARVGGWVMADGEWIPTVQRPLVVEADLAGLMGRESLAAWEILVEIGQLPPMAYGDWATACTDAMMDSFREETLTRLFPGEEANPLIAEWRRRATGGDIVDLDTVIAIFDDVRRSFFFPRESRVGVVRLQGYPRPEVMTFSGPGLSADLFSVRREWEAGVRPITPRDVGRLRRGLSALAPRSRRPGRRSGRARQCKN